jgi:hypothetical protein
MENIKNIKTGNGKKRNILLLSFVAVFILSLGLVASFVMPHESSHAASGCVQGGTCTVVAHLKIGSKSYKTTYTVNYDSTTKVPGNLPSNPGYTIGGWYTDSGFTKQWDFANHVTSNMDLYGKWVAIPKYTVTFDIKSAAGVLTPPATQSVLKGSAATDPGSLPDWCNVYGSKYSFGGWYEKGSPYKYDFTTPVTSDITLEVNWIYAGFGWVGIDC